MINLECGDVMEETYKEAVKKRYDGEKSDEEALLLNVYSLMNPVGRYGLYNTYKVLSWFVRLVMNSRNKSLMELSFLDAGCGKGLMTRILKELTYSDEVYGFDLSRPRIEVCKKLNDSIHYGVGDISDDFRSFDRCFDGILAFDVFMFLRTEENIFKALRNISNALCEGGLFLWYDINAKSHFDKCDCDSIGYSCREMDEFANRVGLELYAYSNLYKNISVFNKSRSTFYLVELLGDCLTEILNYLYPGTPTINIRVYRKCDSMLN